MIQHYRRKIQNEIQKELFKANKSIKIAVAWFTNDLLFQPLVLKLQNGVEVELIINDDEINRGGDNSLDFSDFIHAGGILRWNKTKQLMHDKFCIIDDKIVIFGSYNWTNKAEYNEESIAIAKDEEETLNFYLNKFKKLTSLHNAEKTTKLPTGDNVTTALLHLEKLRFKDFWGDPVWFEIIEQDGKKGLCRLDGTIVLETIFEKIYKLGNLACVKRFRENSQLFNPVEGCFIGPTFQDVIYEEEFSDYFIVNNQKIGCVSPRGILKINCIYDKIKHIGKNAHYCKHNAYLVEKDGKNGIVSEEGKILIPCKYEKISPLLSGGGWPHINYIVKKDKHALFDIKTGEQLTDFVYDNFHPLGYGTVRLSAEKNGKYGLMSFEGELLTNCIYNEIHAFGEKRSNDTDGDLLFYNSSHEVTGSINFYYIVKDDTGWGLINYKGKSVIQCKYETEKKLIESEKNWIYQNNVELEGYWYGFL